MKKSIVKVIQVALSLSILFFGLCTVGFAQQVMDMGVLKRVGYQGKTHVDMLLPSAETMTSGSIYFEAKGGAGGSRGNFAGGGEGAILSGWASVGYEEHEIPPGSVVRFIIGEKGESDDRTGSNTWAGGGGGGGTGILFLAPGHGNGEWKHLIIAGGGGGGYSSGSAVNENGQGGIADKEKDCRDGSGSGTKNGGAGWKGNSNNAVAGWPNYSSNQADPGPVGGHGGTSGRDGGWGYGGGGNSPNVDGGGGGGGACGGGGYEDTYGDGGKSWMNSEFILIEKYRRTGLPTEMPANGYVKYKIRKDVEIEVTEIAIQTSNGHFVHAVCGGGKDVVADKSEILDNEEVFFMNEPGDGVVSFLTKNKKYYFTAFDGGGSTLRADSKVFYIYDGFTIEDAGGGFVAIKTHFGNYWRAVDGGGSRLEADATTVGHWEKFKIIGLQKYPPNYYSEPCERSYPAGGFSLTKDQRIYTKNRMLIMQNDGNLVLYRTLSNYFLETDIVKYPMWSSNTSGDNNYAVFQGDGNLVVYNQDGKDLWSSVTQGNTGANLILQCDGNLVIYSASGGDLFSTSSNMLSYYKKITPKKRKVHKEKKKKVHKDYKDNKSLKSMEVEASNRDNKGVTTLERGLANSINFGLDATSAPGVKVYPNPANNFLTIEVFGTRAENISCLLYNTLGQVVARHNISPRDMPAGLKLDVSGFPKGLYTVMLTADSFKTVEKVVIK